MNIEISDAISLCSFIISFISLYVSYRVSQYGKEKFAKESYDEFKKSYKDIDKLRLEWLELEGELANLKEYKQIQNKQSIIQQKIELHIEWLLNNFENLCWYINKGFINSDDFIKQHINYIQLIKDEYLKNLPEQDRNIYEEINKFLKQNDMQIKKKLKK